MATIAELTSQEFLRIQTNRNTIRAKLVELNLATSTATLDALATAIADIVNRGTVNANVQEGETYTIEPGFYAGGSVAGVSGGGNYALQEKTVTPTKKATTVTSDSGYYGLSAVVVNAIPDNYQDVSDVTATAPDVLLGKVIVLADGTVKAGTMPNNGTLSQKLDTTNATLTLSVGYYAGGTVSITLEEKSVTPSKSAQTVTPSTGKVLSKVTVAAIPDQYQDVTPVTATAPHVLDGDIFVDADGEQVEGTMPNNGAVSKTLTPAAPSYTIAEGFHDGTGKVSIVTETKTATPTKAAQDITPTSGKVLSKVTVAKIPDKYQDVSGVTAAAADVLDGKYIVTSAGALAEGSMPNNGTLALTIDPLTQSSVAIPAGYTPGGSVALTEDLLNALKAI